MDNSLFTFGTTLITGLLIIIIIIIGLWSMSNFGPSDGQFSNYRVHRRRTRKKKKLSGKLLPNLGKYFDLYVDKNHILTLN